jgi:hypothetical protein
VNLGVPEAGDEGVSGDCREGNRHDGDGGNRNAAIGESLREHRRADGRNDRGANEWRESRGGRESGTPLQPGRAVDDGDAESRQYGG